MRCAVLLVALVAASCGDATPYELAGPSAVMPPLPAPSATGSWSGGLSMTLQSQRLGTPVTMSLTQTGDAINGWWSALAVAENRLLVGQDVGGDINGTVTASGAFTGTVTWDSERLGGGRCSGSSGISGAVTRGQILLNTASIPLSGCSAPTALAWNVTPGRF